MATHRVILADDHVIVRAGLRSMIEELPDHAVVAEAEDGLQAIALVEEHRPDVLVLDIDMPRMDGLQALLRVKQLCPRTRVLILSMHDRADLVMRALQAGADGYLLKDAAAIEVSLALKALGAGRVYLSPGVSSTVVQQAIEPKDAARAAPSSLRTPPAELPLTARQVEILRLVVSGHSIKEIAFELGISVKTVESHRAQIMERLQIRSLAQLVLFAVRHGLVAPDGP